MKNKNTMTPEQARQACIEKNKWVNDLKTPEGFTEVDVEKLREEQEKEHYKEQLEFIEGVIQDDIDPSITEKFKKLKKSLEKLLELYN